jgi:glycosyltransferase involved in cell wall biosynthesis
MKILLNSRFDLNSKPGGDTLQIKKTAEYLKRLGVSVNISTELQPDLSNFDLVHIFNITRPHETYEQFQNAKRQKKPVVLTPLYQNFDEWDRKGRFGLQKAFMRIIPDRNTRELFKLFTRAITNIHLYQQFFSQLNNGYVQQQQRILSGVDALLLNSEMEIKLIEKDMGIHNRYFIVPNGIEPSFANSDLKLFEKKYHINNFVLCVANLTSIKNHISLIMALKNTGIKLVLIGKPQKNHHRYFKLVKKYSDSSSDIILINDASIDMIKSAYASAKVHVLPSWFETCGLVSLEAGLAGCNIVSTNRGYAKEYLGNYARYCDPSDISSIKNAVLSAYASPRSNILRSHLLKNFSWAKTAGKTLEVYNKTIHADQ